MALQVGSRQCVRRPRRRTITTQTAPYQSSVRVQASTLPVGWNVGVQTRTFSISVGTQTKAWCSAKRTSQKIHASSSDQMRDCSTHEPCPSSSLTKCRRIRYSHQLWMMLNPGSVSVVLKGARLLCRRFQGMWDGMLVYRLAPSVSRWEVKPRTGAQPRTQPRKLFHWMKGATAVPMNREHDIYAYSQS
ncbi:hypothetical protein MRX96_014016 [Rhipicephalus microplus]